MVQFYQIHENEFNVIYHDHEILFPPHMHNEVEILYMLGGEQSIEIDKKSYALKKGCCAVIFSNIRHSYIRSDDVADKNHDGESVMIFLPPRMLYDAFPALSGTAPESAVLLPDDVSEDAKLAFNKIIGETVPAARIGWAQIILGHIIPRFDVSSDKTGADAVVSKLMNYISTNFRNSITLEILSEELGMSKSQISHIFSDKIRISLRSCVGIQRSGYAAQLMKTSNDTLRNIAAQSGFESLRTFNRVFREVYGLTPSQFRNNIRKYIGQ